MEFKLEPDNLNAPDEELLEDLLKAANKIGKKSVKMREYDRLGRFSSGTIARRFNGWNHALETAGLSIEFHSKVSDDELISDIKRVAQDVAPQKMTMKIYDEKGKYSSQTVIERFGWNNALTMLKLKVSLRINITEKELFQNLESVWVTLGRVPRRRDMVRPVSEFSERPYLNKYGAWRKSLEAFVEYINSDSSDESKQEDYVNQTYLAGNNKASFRHKTKRDISGRLKVQVLIRDGNKCRLCGVVVTGENIHFDHIKPWSKGGETVIENLQVLCAEHNLAKGNFYDEG